MDIVEELRANPEAGAKRLESEYKAGLMTLAIRFLPDVGDAEELVNRTLSAVVSGIDGYVEQSAFFAWMCRILSNIHAKDIRRKANAATELSEQAVKAAVDRDASERIFQEVDAGLLRDAIEELPNEIRETVILHYFMGMSVRTAARFLVVSSGTVAWRLHYARMLLGVKLGAVAKTKGAKAILLALLLATLGICAGVVLSLTPDGSEADLPQDADSAIFSPQAAADLSDGKRESSLDAALEANSRIPRNDSQQQEGNLMTTKQEGKSLTTVKRLSTTVAASALAVASPLGSMDAATTTSHLLYEPDSYVQDGLVVMYDGIRNVGLGVAHDSTTNLWTDLSGNGNDGIFGATPDSDCYWTDTGFYLNGSKSYIQTSGNVTGTECVTVEAVGDWSSQANANYPNLVSVAYNNSNYDCGIFLNSSGQLQWKLNGTAAGLGFSSRPIINGWDKKTFSAVVSTTNSIIYSQGGAVLSSVPARSETHGYFVTNKWNFGINYSASQYRPKGEYRAFRLYNRALTAEEIAANYQLDQYRFVTGIPTTNVLITANIDGVGGDIGTGAFAVDENGYTFTFPASKTSGGNTYALSSCTVAEWDSAADDWSATETTQTIDANDGVSISIANTDKKRITLEWVGPPSFGAATVSGDADTGYTLSFTVASQPATSVTVYSTGGETVLGTASGTFAVGDSGTVSLSSFAGAQLLTATIANASGSTSASLGAFAGGAKLYAYDDFGDYGTEVIGNQAPKLVGFSTSAGWAQIWPNAVRGQATELSFPDFLVSTNREGSVYRRASDGYADAAKRALASDAIPYAGTFYFRFVFNQTQPEEGKTWCTSDSWHKSGNSLGLSSGSATQQYINNVWYNDTKQVGAGPMPNTDNDAIGIYLRTGWDKRTELVAPKDYEYGADYLVCVEVTVSESGNETFRAFAQKVADCTKANTVTNPTWIDCADCAADIASSSAPLAYLTLVTHCASGNTGSIAFDEFRMGATLADIFPCKSSGGLVIMLR